MTAKEKTECGVVRPDIPHRPKGLINNNGESKMALKDEMSIGDKEAKIEIKCAKCNEPVRSDERHTCKEDSDEKSTSEKK
jgi:hypothetical protein